VKPISVILVFLLVCVSSFSQKTPSQVTPVSSRSSIHFYPNPASTTINFEFAMPVERGFSLQVFSFLGRQVLSVPVSSSRVSLNVSDLFKGVYVFQLRDANGRVVASNKFQVSR
jgi:hypothetical protein